MRDIKPLVIFLLAFFAYATLTMSEPLNPQHVTRFALAYSLSEGRVDIDRLAEFTIDKAEFEGHAYADKPPGLSLLAVPSVLVTKALLQATGSTTDPQRAFSIYLAGCILSTVALFGALAVTVLYLLARRLGASEPAALFASFAMGLATPFFGWSTTFFAHVVSGSFLLFALALAVVANGRRTSGTPSRSLEAGVGLLLGFLLVIDLTTAPAAVFVGLFALFGGGDWRRGFWARGVTIALGGIIGLLPLLIYNEVAFHSPFKLGYSEVVGFEGMKTGVFGVSLPDGSVLWELLFGLKRGLLPLSPILLVVPVGIFVMWTRGLRGVALVVVGTILSSLVINAGYAYWDGGWSTGPRHLVAMLPLAGLALAFVQPKSLPARTVIGVLLAVSLVLSVICASTNMFARSEFDNPLVQYLWPMFATPEGLLKAARVLLPWIGFGALLLASARRLRTERHQLAA